MTQDNDAKVKPIEKRRAKDLPPTKVVIRRLPPSLSGETLLEQISPLPNYDFFYFMKADFSLGANAFSRAYINFQNYEDIASFRDKFDGYIFVDAKGNEYPAIVEFATFQKVPKKRSKKPDSKKGTIEQDADYLKFLDSLENPETEEVMSIETYLEQLEIKERETKATKGGPRITTPLIEYIKKRKEEKRNLILRQREERRKREQERKQMKEDERRKRKERDNERLKQRDRARDKDRDREKDGDRDRDTPVKLLKNTDRDKDKNDSRSDKDKDKSNDQKKDKEFLEKDRENGKGREDKPRLRFSKENREKIKEEREKKDDKDRGKPSPTKSDRPRSGRDDWGGRDSDRLRDDRSKSDRDRDRPQRPKSYREEREQRRANRDGDYFRDERPKSFPNKRDDRKYIRADDARGNNNNNSSRGDRGDKGGQGATVSKSDRPASGKLPDSRKQDREPIRSDNSRKSERPFKNEKDGIKGSRDFGKPGSDGGRVDRDKDSGRGDRDSAKGDRPKSDKYRTERTGNQSGKFSRDQSDSKDSGKQEDDQSAASDVKKRIRKERPERAIYDPRKAMERRQGARKGGGKEDLSPRDGDDAAVKEDGTPV